MRCSSGCCAATPGSAIWRSSAELRRAIPGITLSTDIIVGFPGETEADFEETLSLVADAEFDDAYTFKYSVREGTPAVRLKDHVPDEVASARLDRLIERYAPHVRRKNIARVGETHEVLVERPAKRGDLMLGRTRSNHLVLLGLPSAPSASTTRFVSPAPRDPPSLARWSRRPWRFCDQEPGRGPRHRGVRHAAAALSGFLRLRALPGRRADVRPESGSAAVRIETGGSGRDRGEPGEGAEPGGHRGRS